MGGRVEELEANLLVLRGVLACGLREVEGKDGGLVLVRMSGGELASVSREVRLIWGELASLDRGDDESGVEDTPGRANPKGSNRKGGRPRKSGKSDRRAGNGGS